MSQYLIAHIGHTINSHEHITWWKADWRGYSVCIDKAGLYSEDEARKVCKVGSCVAIPAELVRPLARSTPYYRRSDGTLNGLYDGGPHSVVPNELGVWRALLAARLSGCAHPEKPTPITARKARAIYLDGIINDMRKEAK